MTTYKKITISSENGDAINVQLQDDGTSEAATLLINGIRYHFERVKRDQLILEYSLDDDPDYNPQTDAQGYCYLLAPYSG